MSDEPTNPAGKSGFWRRYRRYFLISLVVYLVLMGALLIFGSGPQNQPFRYQIF